MLASVRNSKDGDDVHTVYLLSNVYAPVAERLSGGLLIRVNEGSIPSRYTKTILM